MGAYIFRHRAAAASLATSEEQISRTEYTNDRLDEGTRAKQLQSMQGR